MSKIVALCLAAWLVGPAMAHAEPVTGAEFRRAEAAIGATLGRFDARRRCWLVAVRDQSIVTSGCIRLESARAVTSGTERSVYVRLSGDGSRDCHGCTGIAAYAVLDASGPAWTVSVPPVPRRDGAYGKPTAAKEVTFTRLGAARWGWIENLLESGQGVTEGEHLVLVPRDRVVVDAGDLPAAYSNRGACDAGGGKLIAGCDKITDYTVIARADASDPDAETYPIALHAVGVDGSRRLDKQALAHWDAAEHRYIPPEDFP